MMKFTATLLTAYIFAVQAALGALPPLKTQTSDGTVINPATIKLNVPMNKAVKDGSGVFLDMASPDNFVKNGNAEAVVTGPEVFNDRNQQAVASADIDTATDTLTFAGNQFYNFDAVAFSSTSGVAPTGLTVSTTYYVFDRSATTFKLAASLADAQAGTAVNITAAGSGNQTFLRNTVAAGYTAGSEAATLTRSTSSPLNGAASFVLTHGSAALEGVKWTFKVPRAYLNNVVEISFLYEIGTFSAFSSGNVRMNVWNADSNVAVNMISSGTQSTYLYPVAAGPQRHTIWFIADDTDDDYVVQLYFNGSSNAIGNIKIDDLYVGPSMGYGSSSTPDVFSASVTSAGVVSGENIDWINGACVITSTSIFTCTLNPGLVTTGLNCSISIAQTSDAYVREIASTSTTISWRTRNMTPADVAIGVKVVCQKASPDAQQSVQVYRSIPKTIQVNNVFSAKVTSAGVVSDEAPADWLNGNFAISGTSVFTGQLISGNFTVTPTCVATAGDGSSTSQDIVFNQFGSTASQIQFKTDATDGASAVTLGTNNFTIICTKTGTDWFTPTVQPVIINQVVTNDTAGIRAEWVQINNSGTPAISTQSGAWVSSLVDNGTGDTTLNLVSGIFSDKPACSCSARSGTAARVCTLDSTSTFSSTLIRIQTASDAGAATDDNFEVLCMGAR